jgi:hypothetical protein
MNSKNPNLFIVGAAKAGTTSLYQYLSQHPAVYMCPIKEPNFFAKDIQLEKVRPEIKERFRLLEIDSFIKSDMKNSIHSALIQDEICKRRKNNRRSKHFLLVLHGSSAKDLRV